MAVWKPRGKMTLQTMENSMVATPKTMMTSCDDGYIPTAFSPFNPQKCSCTSHAIQCHSGKTWTMCRPFILLQWSEGLYREHPVPTLLLIHNEIAFSLIQPPNFIKIQKHSEKYFVICRAHFWFREIICSCQILVATAVTSKQIRFYANNFTQNVYKYRYFTLPVDGFLTGKYIVSITVAKYTCYLYPSKVSLFVLWNWHYMFSSLRFYRGLMHSL